MSVETTDDVEEVVMVGTEPVAEVKVKTKTIRTKKKVVQPEVVTKVEDTPPTTTEVEEDAELVEHVVENEYVPRTDDDIIASEIDSVIEDGRLKTLGSPNYKVDNGSWNFASAHPKSGDEYPIGVWVRDPHTLIGYKQAAIERIMGDRARAADYTMVDFADQNAIIDDRNMLAFYAREGAQWANHLEVNGRKLRNSKAKYQTSNLTGIDAEDDQVIAILMDKLDLGVPIVVRLWHSGIIFNINPADKAEAILLLEQLRNAHLDTLRRTNGLIHGTSSYYANRIVVNGFMKRVVASNIDRSLWSDVLNLMDHRDIQFMAWGLLASAHPRGYRLFEQCGGLKVSKDGDGNPVLNEDGSTKKTVCGHKDESNVDLNLLYTIDNSMFTDWQREIMAKPLKGVDLLTREDITKYQSQGLMHAEDTICIDEEKDIHVMIKAPKASVHIDIGEQWIASVETALNDTIDINADETTKNTFIENQLEATASMDVAHWVTGFIIDGKEVRSRNAINRVFRSFANNAPLRDEVFDKIRGGMAKRLAAVPAIPTRKCPSCENMSNTIANNGTVFYTPLDMVSRFFTLTARNQ